MKQALTNLSNFIQSNYTRFFWETVSVAVSAAIGFGVSYFLNQATLELCQDERTELLKQHAEAEVLKASIKYETQLSTKNAQIELLKDENNKLKEKAALDSANRLTELETLRAINQRYRKP